jgi:hypothetical protein
LSNPGNYSSALFSSIHQLYFQVFIIFLQLFVGSIVKWEKDEENKFKYMCLAYKASLEGWKRACRPIVGLDGCFLKGKYGGCCLVAIAMDANNGLYPLAVFICRKKILTTGRNS